MGLGMRVRGLVVSFRFVTNEKKIEYSVKMAPNLSKL